MSIIDDIYERNGQTSFFTAPQLTEDYKLKAVSDNNYKADREAIKCNEDNLPVNAYLGVDTNRIEEYAPKKESDLMFSVPDWGYDDFIYERQSWLKGLDSMTGDPGLFYFKIFFHFDTRSGLFGNILNSENTDGQIPDMPSGDCASRYFDINIASGRYGSIALNDKYSALRKFVMSLSFISSSAPWFFNSISGLDKAIAPSLTNPMDQRFITIECRQDAIDMRLTTLLDLYRYAAYDYVNMKEVLPQNLRQFDMTICLFHAPLKWIDTGTTILGSTYQYRRMNKFIEDVNNGKGLDNTMSYKMITLKGCEFDVESTNSNVPGTISNESGFELGNTAIRITFKRSYVHTFNSWGQFIIGDDAAYYDPSQDVVDDPKNTGFVSGLLSAVSKSLLGSQEGRLGKLADAMYSISDTPTNFISNLTHVSEARYVDAAEDLIANKTGLYYPDIIKGNTMNVRARANYNWLGS